MKKIIKVAIDGGDFIPGHKVRSGIQRLLDSFLKKAKDRKYKRYKLNYYHYGKNGLPKKLFSSLHLPSRIRRDKNDIFLGFSAVIPYFLRFSKIKKILFLYDVGFLKYPKLYCNAKKLKENMIKSIKFSDKIVVLSEYSKKQLKKYFQAFVKNKIEIIYPGLDHVKKIKKGKTHLGKYFLYVGVIKPIKRIEKIQEYASQFKDHRLILIGRGERDYLKKLKLHNGTIHLKNISDRELVNYIINADAVLNFSLEEGFCFPIGEALALGKKVVINKLPIYKELKENIKRKVYRWDRFATALFKLINEIVE